MKLFTLYLKRKYIIFALVAILSILLFRVLFSRFSVDYYYSEQGKCITVWKQVGGFCYVMPYKYTPQWFTTPDDNYFVMETTSYLTIYWMSDTTFFFENNGLKYSSHFHRPYNVYDLGAYYTYYQKLGNPIFDTIPATNEIIVRDSGVPDSVDWMYIHLLGGLFSN